MGEGALERCVSCGYELTGAYCAQCGEKAPDPHDLDRRRHLLEELPRALFELEGPLPRTLVSLFRRPGELAQAFVEGRRRPFVTPVLSAALIPVGTGVGAASLNALSLLILIVTA